MLEIIFFSSSIKSPPGKCWVIQYTVIWRNFFSPTNRSKAWKIIHFKLRRLLYDEICELEIFPNYRSAKILGFCLNVMGIKLDRKNGYSKHYYALHKIILKWVKNNYMSLTKVQPDIAQSCILGSISFDEQKACLIKTYERGLNLEAPKEYLYLARES